MGKRKSPPASDDIIDPADLLMQSMMSSPMPMPTQKKRKKKKKKKTKTTTTTTTTTPPATTLPVDQGWKQDW